MNDHICFLNQADYYQMQVTIHNNTRRAVHSYEVWTLVVW
jgi:hypothetical protein